MRRRKEEGGGGAGKEEEEVGLESYEKALLLKWKLKKREGRRGRGGNVRERKQGEIWGYNEDKSQY